MTQKSGPHAIGSRIGPQRTPRTAEPAFELHPAAQVFPRMSDVEFAALEEDIRVHGVRQPILISGGEILDGRHRFEACQKLGIRCPTVEWTGDGSVVDLVVSLNLKRRHLTPSQSAISAAKALPHYEAEAKQRQRQGRQKVADPGKATEHVERLREAEQAGHEEPIA